MVTGTTSGIGKATALGLAQLGAMVVLVCRDRSKGEAAQTDIQRFSGNACVELLVADLSSQEAVRKLASDYQHTHEYLHVLVNNAGVNLSSFSRTADVCWLLPFDSHGVNRPRSNRR